jgi:hypothetical protein
MYARQQRRQEQLQLPGGVEERGGVEVERSEQQQQQQQQSGRVG